MRYQIIGESLPVVICELESGERMITGPGHVWLQTMPISNVAGAIQPYIMTTEK